MIHKFEFVVEKKLSPEDKAAGKKPDVFHLIYKSKSRRLAKVADKIRAELEKSGIVKVADIENLYLRPTNEKART